MEKEILEVCLTYLLVLGLAVPLGVYMARVLDGKRTFLDRVLGPLDRVLYWLGGVKTEREMDWKGHLGALLGLNLVWFVLAMLVLTNMGWLPLNPDGNPSMGWDLAFNTAVSFVTNTNLQHYSGETGMSYLGQMVLMLWQFISAGCGIAICALVFKAMRGDGSLGNFYALFVRSCTRVLLPLALVLSVIVLFNGSPMTFEGKDKVLSLEGEPMEVSRGPVAAMLGIKQVGTNGGGFYGTNSAHPLENPSMVSNVAEVIGILLIPMGMVFAMGEMLRRRRLAWMVFGVMTAGFLALVVPTVVAEAGGNPAVAAMGIDAGQGNMEGKEVRFGAVHSAYWANSTTCSSNGSVNTMHDSLMPVSGAMTLLGMMANCFYGGVGVGFLNFYVFIVLAVFVSGLMVGRTPALLGKKIEAGEMKIAMLVALLHPLLILGGTALASHLYAGDPEGYAAWLSNPGFHGFSEMLYEFSSSSANNGSGFEGLGDNTAFWNVACGVVMLLARYLPIVGPVAIAGMLAAKKRVPEGAGSLKVDTGTFGLMVFAVIWIVAALAFFPALVLGPLAEAVSF